MSYKLGIAILHVRDLAAAKRFYTEVLELPVIEDQSGPTFITLATAGETLLALQDASTSKPYELGGPGGVEIGLQVEDVDATWRKWQEKGAKTLTPPEDFPFGRAFDGQDPEGHLLSIYQLRAR
jgi:predicted enzyme related to lactoylglutathione lyase